MLLCARATIFSRDEVVSFSQGSIAYINRYKKSAFGKHVIIKHVFSDITLFSLYAHLSSIPSSLKIGDLIPSNSLIGYIGNTSNGYFIPSHRAHLHFEIGIRLSDNFHSWYLQNYPANDENLHSEFNGMNFISIDPLAFFRLLKSNPHTSLSKFISSQKVSLMVDVFTSEIPSIIKENPLLLARPLSSQKVFKWRVAFNHFGFPLSFYPFYQGELDSFQNFHF